MIRTRSGILCLVLALPLSAGVRSTSVPHQSVPEARAPRVHRVAGPGPATAARTAMRIVRGPAGNAFGAGECPSDVEVELWPPNHKYVEIDLEEVLGPATTGVEILSITQDEPIDARADGHTSCDGRGVGTSVASIRAERSGRGNGRVYEIEYSAFDGTCSGFVTVTVPHDRSGAPAVDDGQLHASDAGCP